MHLIYICGKNFWLEFKPWQARNHGRGELAKGPMRWRKHLSSRSAMTGGCTSTTSPGSIAHATMLAKVGLITDAERDEIIEGLKSIERDIEAGKFKFDESLEDIHMVIEAALIERIGEPGKKLHTGRSRNDQVATDLLMWLDEASGEIDKKLEALCCVFIAWRSAAGKS